MPVLLFTAEHFVPVLIKGVAVDFRDEAGGNTIAVGNLAQPARCMIYFLLWKREIEASLEEYYLIWMVLC